MKFNERPATLQEVELESYSYERLTWTTKTIVTDKVIVVITTEQAEMVGALCRQIDAQVSSLDESERSWKVE